MHATMGQDGEWVRAEQEVPTLPLRQPPSICCAVCKVGLQPKRVMQGAMHPRGGVRCFKVPYLPISQHC